MPSDLMPEYDAYEFAISNTNNRKSPRDYKLRQTILSLIYEFFRQRNAVMLYLCETGDNRQKYQSRLFESWFRSSGYQKTFVLMTAELPDEYGIWNYVALILRPDHPQFVSIAQQFSDTIALFRDKPEPYLTVISPTHPLPCKPQSNCAPEVFSISPACDGQNISATSFVWKLRI